MSEKATASPVRVPYLSGRGSPGLIKAPTVLRKFLFDHVDSLRPVNNPFFYIDRILNLGPSIGSSRDAIARILDDASQARTAPVFCGGDHGITAHLLDAISIANEFVRLVVFDAHSDVQGTECELRNWNMLRQIRNTLGDRLKICHIGFRDADFSELSRIADLVLSADDFTNLGFRETALALQDFCGRDPVYISIDLDVLDPLCFSSVSSPISGGLLPQQILSLLEALKASKLIAADLVEYDVIHPNPLELLLIADLFQKLTEISCLENPVSRTH